MIDEVEVCSDIQNQQIETALGMKAHATRLSVGGTIVTNQVNVFDEELALQQTATYASQVVTPKQANGDGSARFMGTEDSIVSGPHNAIGQAGNTLI